MLTGRVYRVGPFLMTPLGKNTCGVFLVAACAALVPGLNCSVGEGLGCGLRNGTSSGLKSSFSTFQLCMPGPAATFLLCRGRVDALGVTAFHVPLPDPQWVLGWWPSLDVSHPHENPGVSERSLLSKVPCLHAAPSS